MNPFQYARPVDLSTAVKLQAKDNTSFLAGGTNLVDLMKMGIMMPEKIVDINRLPLKNIEPFQKGLRLGALATNSEVADHPVILKDYPLLAIAINAGASAQLRNMATVGGNLMQKTRCPYFFDAGLPCNKRNPGTGCGALEGFNRMHAIFGASEHCIAVHPSDMCVALTALDAIVQVKGPLGDRSIPFSDFHRLPGDQPHIDNTLRKEEIITSVDLPAPLSTPHVHYLKIRDRSSYAFALVSVAVALETDRDNIIRNARLAMGGVAHKPWRLRSAEVSLINQPATPETFTRAAAVAMEDAKAYHHNQFKLKLAPNAILQALKSATA